MVVEGVIVVKVWFQGSPGDQKKFARAQMLETLNQRIVEGIDRYERGDLGT